MPTKDGHLNVSTDSEEGTQSETLAIASRTYSPIIEDPNERDSRRGSTDLLESSMKDDDVSISSRAISLASGSVPTSSDSPISEQPQAMTPTSEAIASVSSPSQAQSLEPTEPTIDQTKSTQASNETAKKDEPKSNKVSSQPIFKPLTDKGKSKTTGKNIGGWI